MKSSEIVVISIFAALFLAALVYALRQGARTRERLTQYAMLRGGTVLSQREGVDLAIRLGRMTPDWSWSVTPVARIHPAPQAVYLFSYQISRRGGSRSTSIGFACLAERAASAPAPTVEIERRLPLVERLIDDRVTVGSEEFQREFTVSCSDAEVARAVVNPELQRVLLEEVARTDANAGVVIGASEVVVKRRWAQSETGWDTLIGLAVKLRAASIAAQSHHD